MDCGTHAYPLKGTVTYLSDLGAPTILLPNGIGTATASEHAGGLIEGPYLLSFPKVGKHVTFDGRILHGAPVDDHIEKLMQAWSEMCGEVNNEKRKKRRMTFLVNVWLDNIPSQSSAYPEKKLSGLHPCVESETELLRVTGTAKESTEPPVEINLGKIAYRHTVQATLMSNNCTLKVKIPFPTVDELSAFMTTPASNQFLVRLTDPDIVIDLENVDDNFSSPFEGDDDIEEGEEEDIDMNDN